jgi:hypothetical protein
MLKRLVLFCIIGVTVDAQGPRKIDDATVAAFADEMLERAGIADEIEHAAFIAAGSDGTMRLVHWLGNRAFREAHWNGPLPDGVVAVIHTHPHRSPLPSRQDAFEARRLGMPFYVVSRASLSVAEPDGRIRRAARIPWLLRFRKLLTDVRLDWYDYGTSFT